MYFFTDTNIPVGYTVIHDRWHSQSTKFINEHENSIFWSNFVRKEYNDKLCDILIEIDEFLKLALSILENNEKDFFSYLSFEKFMLNSTHFCKLDMIKKQRILHNLWQKNNFIIGISTNVHLCFLNFVHDFERNYIIRDLKLNEIMKLHDCGLDNYLKHYDYALKLFKRGIHPPDCKIIIDAHDCGLTHGNLIFISNDMGLIDTISQMDTSFLEIIEFKSCNN